MSRFSRNARCSFTSGSLPRKRGWVRVFSHSIAAAILLVLSGCEQAPPVPEPAQVIEQSQQTVREAEAAIAEVQKSTAEATAKLESAKPRTIS